MRTVLVAAFAVLSATFPGCGPAAVTQPTHQTPSSAEPAAVWLAVTSPDSSRPARQLADITQQVVVPALGKLAGVSEVRVVTADPLGEVNDAPAVLLVVTPKRGGASAEAVRTATAQLTEVPAGVAVAVVLDEAADRPLTVAVQLPDGAGPDRTQQTLARAGTLLRTTPGVAGTLAYLDPKRSNAGTVLVKRTALKPSADEVGRALLQALPEAKCVVSDKAAGR